MIGMGLRKGERREVEAASLDTLWKEFALRGSIGWNGNITLKFFFIWIQLINI